MEHNHLHLHNGSLLAHHRYGCGLGYAPVVYYSLLLCLGLPGECRSPPPSLRAAGSGGCGIPAGGAAGVPAARPVPLAPRHPASARSEVSASTIHKVERHRAGGRWGCPLSRRGQAEVRGSGFSGSFLEELERGRSALPEAQGWPGTGLGSPWPEASGKCAPGVCAPQR